MPIKIPKRGKGKNVNSPIFAIEMDPDFLEANYVRKAYEDMAVVRPADETCDPRERLPSVLNALRRLPPNSLILDIGCGPSPHCRPDTVTVGLDLVRPSAGQRTLLRTTGLLHFVLADCRHLPFRRDAFDAVLLVNIVHHLATEQRRMDCLRQCLSVARLSNSLLLVVAWAKEQQSARFPADDVLVPYNLEELGAKGHIAEIPFNKFNTKEQRIIMNSVPVRVNAPPKICCNPYLPPSVRQRIQEAAARLSWLRPVLSVDFCEQRIQLVLRFLIERISDFKQIQSAIVPNSNSPRDPLASAREFALKLSLSIFEDAFAQLRTLHRDVLKYRFYHVFRRGELEGLLRQIQLMVTAETPIGGGFEVSQCEMDCGNWVVLLERRNSRASITI